ncbi:GNAT family N-acetyltransferase [Stappia sp.]|uniref:GNAT family N-acetyltransferase n=1 Tax=Stappia sp. TaxID=1870903 RepID=UPI0032D8CFF2
MLTHRLARPEDADALLAIAREAYAGYIPAIGRRPAPMDADYAAHIRDDTVFVLSDGAVGELAGFAVVIDTGEGFVLDNLAVAGAWRGRGCGARLIALVEAFIAARADRYTLYTNAVMTRNAAWYRRLGFRETGRATVDGFDRIFFEKTLSR